MSNSKGIAEKFQLSLIWEKREYRLFGMSLFFIGTAVSSSYPYITLFLVQNLHINASLAGLFFLTALVGPIVAIAVGRFSDRLPSRLPLIRFSAVWLAIGWSAMAMVTQFWLAIGIAILFFCFNGALSALIFASIRDVMSMEGEMYESTVNSTIRTAYSLGWVIGPAVGSWLVAVLGIRFAFFSTSLLYLISLLPFLGLYIRNANTSELGAKHKRAAKNKVAWIDGRLLCFALLGMVVLSGDTIKSSYLPLYLVENLKQSPVVFGYLLSVSAIVELIIIPSAGMLADKVGTGIVILAGMAIGVVDYAVLANSTHLWQLYIVQILHVGVLAALLGLGITYAQQLNREQPGLASSMVLAGQSLASPLGGIIGSYGVLMIGLPKVFFIPAIVCLLSSVLFLAVYRRNMTNQ